MKTVVKIGGFALGLAAIFAAALAVGSAIGPVPDTANTANAAEASAPAVTDGAVGWNSNAPMSRTAPAAPPPSTTRGLPPASVEDSPAASAAGSPASISGESARSR